MENHETELLMDQAREILKYSYSPYSNFPVGCAMRMKDGRIITGVNVENVSFGVTNCAERSAIFSAIGQGYQKGDIEAIAVAGKTDDFLPPCSVCRQVLVEFCGSETPVYLTRNDETIKTVTLGELVPFAFTELEM